MLQEGSQASPGVSPSRPVSASVQQQQQEQAAPVSFRKRPRKPPRPQCSGPSVFCQPPSPDASKASPNGKGSPSAQRQLRPRQNVVGRWSNKGFRHHDRAGGKEGHNTSPEQSLPQRPAATVSGTSNNASEPHAEVAVAAALPDNMLFVDGVMTTWTDTADRSIMLSCLIQAQGHPSPEVFDGLVSEICESGCHVKLQQVRARFNWLLNRFLANYNQQAA